MKNPIVSLFPYTKPRYPIIFGLKGDTLTGHEEEFFKSYPPLGFVLFKRNMASFQQTCELTASLRETVGETDLPILIDEEGGSISRLAHLGPQYKTLDVCDYQKIKDSKEREDLIYENYSKIASWLNDLNITVNCAPVLDILLPTTASFLRSRCLSHHIHEIERWGGLMSEALRHKGITSVMKHIPGHGQARQDSHYELPVVDLPPLPWKETDRHHEGPIKNFLNALSVFRCFKAVCPWAMSSHLLFPALDTYPVTFSRYIVQEMIRKPLKDHGDFQKNALSDFFKGGHEMDFPGFLISDDLCMNALHAYSMKERVLRALDAGHDAALVCHGSPTEWEPLVQSLQPKVYWEIPRLYKSLS